MPNVRGSLQISFLELLLLQSWLCIVVFQAQESMLFIVFIRAYILWKRSLPKQKLFRNKTSQTKTLN